MSLANIEALANDENSNRFLDVKKIQSLLLMNMGIKRNLFPLIVRIRTKTGNYVNN